jgi:serine protease AprX
VIANKATYHIRVANLSLGHPIRESAATDPLVLAAERLWDAGIVVVCSAGNYGLNGYGTITSPGNSPKVITVGSLSDFGTTLKSDDQVSSYSSRGPTLLDHFVKPDLLAPGNRLISSIPKTSYLASLLPERLIVNKGNETNDMILSGSSQEAAVVSGTVALMLDKDPSLSPATVKARLMRSATKPPAGSPFLMGAGVLDPSAARSDTGFAAAAPSPEAYRDLQSGRMGFDNSRLSSGSPQWSEAVRWSDAVLRSDTYVGAGSAGVTGDYVAPDAALWTD